MQRQTKLEPASKKFIHEMEAGYINSLLRKFNGNRREVAEFMGISERTVYRKLKRYNIK